MLYNLPLRLAGRRAPGGREPALRAAPPASWEIRGGDRRPRARQRRVPRGLHALRSVHGGGGQQPNPAQGALSFWEVLEQVKKGSLPVFPSRACVTHEGVLVGDLPLSSFRASSFSPWLHPSLAPSIPFLERGAPCGRTGIAQEIEELAVGGKGCHCCIWRWRLDRGPAGQPPSALWISAPLCAPRPTDGWWFPALLERQTKFFLCCLRLFLSL